MERQCWANAQYSKRECLEIVGIPSLVHHYQQEDSVCKTFGKPNCNVVNDNLEDCHCLKDDCVTVKFSKKKDCEQVLSVKNDLKILIWLTLALREMI